MKTYIDGYYCRDDLHLQVMNKDSNRRILDALKDVYPEGLTVEELAKKTKLPVKTIYAQKAELYREYYINHLEEGKEEEEEEEKYKPKRGRPPAAAVRTAKEALRKRVRLVIENATGVHDPYQGTRPTPLPPGNVVYSNGFTEAWHKIVQKDEEDDLCKSLLQFLERIFNRIVPAGHNINEEEIKEKWAPEMTKDFCCSQCGLNHEARDFIRAMLLHLIDQLERNDKFIDFLKDNQLLTSKAYEHIVARKK